MRKRPILLLLPVAALSLLFASCGLFGGDDTHITVSDDQLYGRWQKRGTFEYWRYRTDGTGVTWDESEDVTEEESNLTYEWTLNGDRLTHVFHGAEDNQAVPKVYTIKEISATAMKWEDDYKMEYLFTKAD